MTDTRLMINLIAHVFAIFIYILKIDFLIIANFNEEKKLRFKQDQEMSEILADVLDPIPEHEMGTLLDIVGEELPVSTYVRFFLNFVFLPPPPPRPEQILFRIF